MKVANMATKTEWSEIRMLVAKHIEAMTEDVSEYEIGYWPDTNEAFVDAIMAMLAHQDAINQYHEKTRSNFDLAKPVKE